MRAFDHDSSSFTGFRAILLAKAAPPSPILASCGWRRLSKRRQIHVRRRHFERCLQGHETWLVDQRVVGQSSGHAPPFGGGTDGGIYLAGGQTPGAARREKNGLRGAVRPGGSVAEDAKFGRKLRYRCCDATVSQSGWWSAWCGRGDLNSHVLSDNRF